jgi:hypothetical protein
MFYLLYRIRYTNKYWIIKKDDDQNYLMENHRNLKYSKQEEYTVVNSNNIHDNFYFDSFDLFTFNKKCKVIYRK